MIWRSAFEHLRFDGFTVWALVIEPLHFCSLVPWCKASSLLRTDVESTKDSRLGPQALRQGVWSWCVQIHCIPSYFCLVYGVVVTVLGAIGGMRGIINSASGALLAPCVSPVSLVFLSHVGSTYPNLFSLHICHKSAQVCVGLSCQQRWLCSKGVPCSSYSQ